MSQLTCCDNCGYWHRQVEKGLTVSFKDVVDTWPVRIVGVCHCPPAPIMTGWHSWCRNHTNTDELQNYLAELQVAADQL